LSGLSVLVQKNGNRFIQKVAGLLLQDLAGTATGNSDVQNEAFKE